MSNSSFGKESDSSRFGQWLLAYFHTSTPGGENLTGIEATGWIKDILKPLHHIQGFTGKLMLH